MSAPQQSLRKHRQTLLPGAVPPKKSYGELDTYAKAELPSVALKDKEKVGNLVKKRFSSRVQGDNSLFRLGDDLPPLPSNASTMISEAQTRPSPVSGKHQRQQQQSQPQQQKKKLPIKEGGLPQIPAEREYPAKSPRRSQKGSVSSAAGSLANEQEPIGQGYAPRETAEQHARKKSYTDSRKPQISNEPVTLSHTPSGEAIDSVFLDKKFDAKAYIASQLYSSTDVEISAFADTLQDRREQLQIDRKDELHRNYKTFLNIGGQISGFGADVDALRRYISDFRAVTTALVDDAENSLMNAGITSRTNSYNDSEMDGPAIPALNSNRSSVVMLEKMWADELSSLFKHVEGAQQYLPVVPGRHLRIESGGWYQLNAATWKPLQPVHIFLLNDNLLIATKKRSPRVHSKDASVTSIGSSTSGSATKRLIADICWPLFEIELIDLSRAEPVGSSLEQNTKASICVKAGGTKFVYRAERPEAHQKVLKAFREAKSELSKLQRSGSIANLGDMSRDQSLRNGQGLSKSPSARSALSIDNNNSKPGKEHINSVATTSQDIKEIDNAISNLDINIAYHRFEKAISDIERYQTELASPNNKYRTRGLLITGDTISLHDLFKNKLDVRTTELSDLLLTELSYDYVERQQIQQYVRLLVKLGVEERAKKVFLDSRHSQLQRRIKLVEFHGDIVNYIRQIAIIYFRMISATVDIFRGCFSDFSHTSAVVEWARKEMDSYIILFSRQLYKVEPNTTTYQKCIEITKLQDKQLAKQGLDLSFLLKVIYDAGI